MAWNLPQRIQGRSANFFISGLKSTAYIFKVNHLTTPENVYSVSGDSLCRYGGLHSGSGAKERINIQHHKDAVI